MGEVDPLPTRLGDIVDRVDDGAVPDSELFGGQRLDDVVRGETRGLSTVHPCTPHGGLHGVHGQDGSG